MRGEARPEMKTCSECGSPRPLALFLPTRNGRLSRCLDCLKKAAQAHRDRAAAMAKTASHARRSQSRRARRDEEAKRHWQRPL
jgi:recombinational DNA repair protein (RecF pathway)